MQLLQELVLSRVFNRTFVLDEAHVQKGLSNRGDTTRLHAVLHKLLQGTSIDMSLNWAGLYTFCFLHSAVCVFLAIGVYDSLTLQTGGAAGDPITVVVLGGSVTEGGDVYRMRAHLDTYFGQFVSWINKTFPHPDHKFHNGALSATGSAFFSVCTDDRVKHTDVDLAILEFDINDSNSQGKLL